MQSLVLILHTALSSTKSKRIEKPKIDAEICVLYDALAYIFVLKLLFISFINIHREVHGNHMLLSPSGHCRLYDAQSDCRICIVLMAREVDISSILDVMSGEMYKRKKRKLQM